MPSRYVPNTLVWLLMISNTMLVLIVMVKLRTTSSDVLIELQNASLAVELKIDDVKAQQDHMSNTLQERQKWMMGFTDAFTSWASKISDHKPQVPAVPGHAQATNLESSK